MNKLQAPAFTYATPSRAVRSVEKMSVASGGKEVRFVISKDSKGRYFPVFIGRVKQISDREMELNPSANKRAAKKVAAVRKAPKVKKAAKLH